ncbi:hypothetical protein ACDA63_19280 [Uliginosibacterium sp. sgz301328]|uniref:hypothetical protein n=1 Tax=Uliginosibacterium sp. sgz301328 TaxID=3243764 RepID=UPI00359DB58C
MKVMLQKPGGDPHLALLVLGVETEVFGFGGRLLSKALKDHCRPTAADRFVGRSMAGI